MKNAVYKADTFFILGNSGTPSGEDQTLLFRSSRSTVTFPGYLAALDIPDGDAISHQIKVPRTITHAISYAVGQCVYLYPNIKDNASHEGYDESALEVEDYDDAADMWMTRNMKNAITTQSTQNGLIAKESVAQSLDFGGLIGRQHITRPPPRFSTASFIKDLEKLGVGRPSTYATVLSTLSGGRGYIRIDKNTHIPTVTGMIVDNFLCDHFKELTESDFTSNMEAALDQISNGEKENKSFLSDFLFRKG